MKETCEAIGKLEGWLSANEKTQAWLARVLGITAPSVNAWFREQSRPDAHHRETIEILTHREVPRDSWEFESERAARKRAIDAALQSPEVA